MEYVALLFPRSVDRGDLGGAVRWKFKVLVGVETDLQRECDGEDVFIIGASEQAQLLLAADPHVSGVHCLIETRGFRCFVRDLDSRNGTWINGQRVEVGELVNGDQLRVGRTPIAVTSERIVEPEDHANCVRCGRAMALPESGGTQREFVCSSCWDSQSVTRTLSARVGASGSCTECGETVSTVNLDGRAIELGSVASYLCEPCAVKQPSSSGQTFVSAGYYDILHQIGTGGFGAVWFARHRTTGRLAAVKTALSSALSNDDRAANWFRREMAIARELVHPNIARWYDSGEQDRVVYFAAEYVVGGSLEHRMKTRGQGRLPASLAVEFAIQALYALEYAHGQGIVHRDIKPSNLLIGRGPDGCDIVKVTDFGLAKSLASAGASLLTESGEVRGTPLFMAPEQMLNYRYAGPSVDVYSVGATLYHLLTGRGLFDDSKSHRAKGDGEPELRKDWELLRMILEEVRVPVREHCPDIHEELAAIVDIAVQRDETKRFDTATSLRVELERIATLL